MRFQVIGEHESSLKQALASFGVYLKPSSFGQDVKPLLKESCKGVFGSASGLVDQFVRYFPSSRDGAAQKVGPRCSASTLVPTISDRLASVHTD